MKKNLSMAAVLSMIAISYASHANAQFRVHVNIGFPAPVVVAPAPVIISEPAPVVVAQPEYYYYPDINVYFDPIQTVYYLFSGNAWVPYYQCPPQFARYDFGRGRREVFSRAQFDRRLGFDRAPMMAGRMSPRGNNNFGRGIPQNNMRRDVPMAMNNRFNGRTYGGPQNGGVMRDGRSNSNRGGGMPSRNMDNGRGGRRI